MGFLRKLGHKISRAYRKVAQKPINAISRGLNKVNSFVQPGSSLAKIGIYGASKLGYLAIPGLGAAIGSVALGLQVAGEVGMWVSNPKKRAREWENKYNKAQKAANWFGKKTKKAFSKKKKVKENKLAGGDSYDVNNPNQIRPEGQRKAIGTSIKKYMALAVDRFHKPTASFEDQFKTSREGPNPSY